MKFAKGGPHGDGTLLVPLLPAGIRGDLGTVSAFGVAEAAGTCVRREPCALPCLPLGLFGGLWPFLVLIPRGFFPEDRHRILYSVLVCTLVVW